MIVLKLLGIILLILAVLIALILLIRVHIVFEFSTESGASFFVRVLGIKFGNKKKDGIEPKPEKDKKPSRIAQRFKRLFGLDVLTDPEALKDDTEKRGISGTVERLITLFALVAGQVGWLVSKFRLDSFKLYAVCGGEDAADAAIEYGITCAAVYPLAGAIDASLHAKKGATDIRVGCDFDAEPSLILNIDASVRVVHIVRAIWKSTMIAAEKSQPEEA